VEKLYKRMYAFLATTYRYNIESFGPKSVQDEELERLHRWITNNAGVIHLNKWEQQLIDTPPGKLTRDDAYTASWLMEGAGVIAWALQLFPLPKYDVEVSRDAKLASATKFLFGTPSPDNMIMRPMEELETYRWLIKTCHWRIREFSMNPCPIDFLSLFDATSRATILASGGIDIVEGDMALQGCPIFKADNDVIEECRHLISERHRCISWILEDGDYYEIELNT
jgi:hypothetical protein